MGGHTPREWRADQDHFYQSSKPGLSNRGHDVGIFVKNGKEILSDEEKRDLIIFLKTL